MNTKAKETRAIKKAEKILDAMGYTTLIRSRASLTPFDLCAIGSRDVKLIQLKSGSSRLSEAEREQIKILKVPPNVSKECWRFPDRARMPKVEVL